MRKCNNAVMGEKLTRYESSVRGCVVIMEQPIGRAPQFRSFSPNVLPQTAKNTAVELGVHGLAFRSKLKVHNPSNVEKPDEHALGRAAALPRLLHSLGSWALPLRRLLFNLGIITVDPTLIPSDDTRHEGWVVQGTLTKLLTNCNKVLFLFGGQKPGHELCSNAVHVLITREKCLHYSVWHINDWSIPLTVLRRSSCTSRRIVSTFLGVELMEGRPDLSKHLARLMASFPYARRFIWKVSAPDLLSFTQNLLSAPFSRPFCNRKCEGTRGDKHLCCATLCSHSDATRHAEWRRSLLLSIANAFTYCHGLAVCGTSLETFWFTYVCIDNQIFKILSPTAYVYRTPAHAYRMSVCTHAHTYEL